MGPAAVFNAIIDPDVSQVVVCDMLEQQLDACMSKIARAKGAAKMTPVLLDLNNQLATADVMSEADVVIAALPWSRSVKCIEVALQVGIPYVDIARPDLDHLSELRRKIGPKSSLVMLGCGLEPGLTEIMACYLATQLDQVDELHIRCGGIPAMPAPPLGYKIVFGGRQLPLYESDAYVLEDGELRLVPCYSGVESINFPGVGECEAWHDGLLPWLVERPTLKGLRVCTQKTVRWPGFAAKVAVLKEMGLLSQEPVEVNGLQVVPKKLLDSLLYPHVKLKEGEQDITIFRVEAVGKKASAWHKYKLEMIDRFDESSGFTSMARTTAFPAAIVARMIARGEVEAGGIVTPEEVMNGVLFRRLVEDMAAMGIRFSQTSEKIEIL